MYQQTLYVKGMVCRRCLYSVENQLIRLGHTPISLTLGEVSFIPGNSPDLEKLNEQLSTLGFSVLREKKVEITQRVKDLIQYVYGGEFDFTERFRFSELARQRIGKEYEAISDAFIAVEKKSIEQYIIEYRIKKVKELLVYESMSLSEIAFKLNFNSPSHLSAQFKQQTGLSPSHFRNLRMQKMDTVISKS